MRKGPNTHGKLPLLAVALLAACGGAGAPGLAPDEAAAPAFATLAGGAGPGAERLAAGDLVGAREAFEAALSADPERLAPLNDLAVSYLLEGHLDAARNLLDEVVAEGSGREQQAALVNLGELYAVEGHAGAAVAHLETARGLDASRAEPLYALALLADARGEAEAARRLVAEALRLDDGQVRRGLVFAFAEERAHLEALVAEEQGDAAAARAAWRELAGGRFPALAAAAQRHLGER